MQIILEILFNPVTFFLGPLVAPAFSIYTLRRESAPVRVLTAALFWLASFAFFYGGGMCWALRDGLGPKSVTSAGAEAVSRFSEGFLFYGVATGVFAFLGSCVARCNK